MDILVILIPVSLSLGSIGLLAFLWTLKHRQYEDPAGDAARILSDAYDDQPCPADQSTATKLE
jgi:cbb3-type cytochrome oxidase maturation protein